jgi:hypothetical protein
MMAESSPYLITYTVMGWSIQSITGGIMVNAKGLIAMMALLSALVLAACGGSSAKSPSTASAPAQPAAAPSGWSSMAPLILANSETAVAEVDGLIYVVGGYPSSREISNAVQVYLPAEDRWRLAIPLPVPTHHAMAAAVNGKLYVIGGEG